MIDLKDIIQLWLATNKNVNRSWALALDPGGVWVLSPKIPRHYKTNSRAIMLADCVKLHYDNDSTFMDKGCNTETILAYDKEFFQKLSKWMRFVRRR